MLRSALASGPSLDEPHVMSRHLSPAYIEKSPYFQEWQKPAGMVDFMMFFLMHEPMHLSTFGVGRNLRQGIEGTRMAEALDALRCAVLLTNEHGTILHANRTAEHMLDKGGPIQSAQGVLQATAPSAASELRSALTLAAGNEAGLGKTGLAIRLTEPDVLPVFAHVLPRQRFPHAAATPGRRRYVHRCATGRPGGCRRTGCRLWSDAGRNQVCLPACSPAAR